MLRVMHYQIFGHSSLRTVVASFLAAAILPTCAFPSGLTNTLSFASLTYVLNILDFSYMTGLADANVVWERLPIILLTTLIPFAKKPEAEWIG